MAKKLTPLIQKRKSIRIASYYYEDQMEDLDIIVMVNGGTRSELMRKAVEQLISDNKKIIADFKKR